MGKGSNQRTLKTMNVCINIRYFRLYDLLILLLNTKNSTVLTQASLRRYSDAILKKILNTTKQASIGQENVHIKKAKKKSLKTNQELKILKIIQVLSTVQFQIVQLPTASTLSTHERRWFPDERKDFNKRSENFEDHICVIHMKTFRCFSLLISLV